MPREKKSIWKHFDPIEDHKPHPHVRCKYCSKDFKRALPKRLEKHFPKRCPEAPNKRRQNTMSEEDKKSLEALLEKAFSVDDLFVTELVQKCKETAEIGTSANKQIVSKPNQKSKNLEHQVAKKHSVLKCENGKCIDSNLALKRESEECINSDYSEVFESYQKADLEHSVENFYHVIENTLMRDPQEIGRIHAEPQYTNFCTNLEYGLAQNNFALKCENGKCIKCESGKCIDNDYSEVFELYQKADLEHSVENFYHVTENTLMRDPQEIGRIHAEPQYTNFCTNLEYGLAQNNFALKCENGKCIKCESGKCIDNDYSEVFELYQKADLEHSVENFYHVTENTLMKDPQEIGRIYAELQYINFCTNLEYGLTQNNSALKCENGKCKCESGECIYNDCSEVYQKADLEHSVDALTS